MAATVMPKQSDQKPATSALSRRERQVMDILHRRSGATVAEIMADLPDPPTYSAVRSVLRILGEKELIKHREDGPRYVYEPTETRERARRSALHHLVRTFFDGSAAQAVSALLDSSDLKLDANDADRLAELIEKAKEEGR